MKITIIPEVLGRHLKTFRKLMSKPQFVHFSAYCTGLIAAEKKNISQIAHTLPHGHQSSLNRFLTKGVWDRELARSKALLLVKPFIKDAVFIVDDTLAHKTGKHMEGAALHYDNLHKRKCFGHSIVTSGYSQNNAFIPFRLEVYQRKESLSPGSRFMTKNRLALGILKEALQFKQFRYLLIDAWYTNKKIIRFLREKRQHFIGDLKSNRNVTINKRRKSVQSHCFVTKMKEFVLNDCRYRAYMEDAYLPGIGKMKIVFAQAYLDNKWTETKYLVTDMFHLTAMQCIAAFNRRHAIEAFHRDGKQELALETFHMRKYVGVVTHLACVLIAYLLVILSKTASRMSGSIGDFCRKVKRKAQRHTLNLFMHCKASLKMKQQAASFICC